jgi:hypothetical protein
MAVLGFTTVGSQLKEQTDKVKEMGIEAFGVSVIDDAEGKHEPIKASNAQLHLFMQLKRGNVTHLILQSSEQAGIFLENIYSYYGKEKADRVLSAVKIIAIGDAEGPVKDRGLAFSVSESFLDALSSL